MHEDKTITRTAKTKQETIETKYKSTIAVKTHAWAIRNNYTSILFFLILGYFLPNDHPGAQLSQFSLPISEEAQNSSKAAYAALYVAKSLKNR